MNQRKFYILIVSIVLVCHQFNTTNGSFIDWIWPNRNLFKTNSHDSSNLPSIQFELSDSNEKFIEDASGVIGRKLSPSDFCQQRVILSLKVSCNSLSDEELSKLAVALFNCQRNAENREGVECSENMDIKDCVESMAEEEYAVYTAIYSKAKQMCLGIRQDQFRGLTELTINKLLSSTHQHLDLMERLKDSQKLMEKATLTSLDEITDGHLKLLDNQQEILKLSEFQRSNTEANVREILKEKNLLKIGNNELNSFIVNLRQKINEGLAKVHSQSEDTAEAYTSLLSDLEQLNLISSRIAKKLDEINDDISEMSEDTYVLLERTKKRLELTSDVVSEFSETVMNMKNEFNKNVEWIANYLGEENLMEKVKNILVHVATLLIGMLCLVFVNADVPSRYIFLTIIGLNMACTLNGVYPLRPLLLLNTLTVLLVGNVVTRLNKKFQIKENTIKWFNSLEFFPPKKEVECERQATPEATPTRPNSDISTNRYRREDLNITHANGHFHHMTSHLNSALSRPVSRLSVDREGSIPSTVQRRLDRDGSNTSLSAGQCTAITGRGARCSFTAYGVNGLCTIHNRSSRDRER